MNLTKSRIITIAANTELVKVAQISKGGQIEKLVKKPVTKGAVDAALRVVDIAAIPPNPSGMTSRAFVFCDQLLTQFEIGTFENGRLCCRLQGAKQEGTNCTVPKDAFHFGSLKKKAARQKPGKRQGKSRVPNVLSEKRRRPRGVVRIIWRRTKSRQPASWHRHRSRRLAQAWEQGPTCQNHRP